jgi:hypothetical protein
MKISFGRLFPAALAGLVLASFAMAPLAEAARGGGARGGGARAGGAEMERGGGARQRAEVNNSRADVRTNSVRSASVNNVNVNRNVDVNRNVNVNVEHRGCCGWDNDYHPVATAAAVGATVAVTSAVVGSIVRSVPAGCAPVNYGGMVYQQCGGVWYAPQGTQYVVVNPPY